MLGALAAGARIVPLGAGWGLDREGAVTPIPAAAWLPAIVAGWIAREPAGWQLMTVGLAVLEGQTNDKATA